VIVAVAVVVHIAERIFGASHGVADFAFGLLHLPFDLELLVSQRFAGTLFDATYNLLSRALHAILVHDILYCLLA
jgi:hypothetical protein